MLGDGKLCVCQGLHKLNIGLLLVKVTSTSQVQVVERKDGLAVLNSSAFSTSRQRKFENHSRTSEAQPLFCSCYYCLRLSRDG